MPRRSRQLELSLPSLVTHGGARAGAGRQSIPGRRPPVPHRSRTKHIPRFPVHVTFRAAADIPSLRSTRCFEAVLAAIRRGSNGRFRIVAFSVQADHVHAVVEADHSRAFVAGARGLAIRMALAVNRTLARTGPVWGDRYHARPLRTPAETRSTLLYVIQNWKKHVRGSVGIDGRSSGPWFDGWVSSPPRPSRPIPIARPRTWLASGGWRERGGGPLRTGEGPALAPSRRRRADPT